MNKEKELDMNELIESFGECSTDYTKTACTYYANYLEEYQKEKIRLEQENKELHNKIDKAIEALDGIRKIIETEKRLMGYAIYDSCLLLIEEQLDKAKDLKDSDIDDNR